MKLPEQNFPESTPPERPLPFKGRDRVRMGFPFEAPSVMEKAGMKMTPSPQHPLPFKGRDRVGMGMRLLLPLALLLLSLLSGCGYHSVAARDPLSGANGVNVVVFANKSYRQGLEGELSRYLIDELALRTGGKVLPADLAQLELTGTVLSYATTALSYTAADAIREYKVAITVEAVLTERQTRKVLWKGELTGDQSYPVNPNIALQANAEEAAVTKVCRRLSEDIWQKIGERF